MKERKILLGLLISGFLLSASLFADSYEEKYVQVVTPVVQNVDSATASWLPGQIRDSLKSNLQDYANYITTVDEGVEARVKEIQKKSESAAYDEQTAIEIGKLVNAKYAVFSTIRKNDTQYVLNCDFTNLSTGLQVASATSKAYSSTDKLYSSGGAVDEITIALCKKMGIPLSATQFHVLQYGDVDLTNDQRKQLATENEENYKKQLENLNKEIQTLSISTDLKKDDLRLKLEASKALLEAKKNASHEYFEDLVKEENRTLEVKKLRDSIAADAEKKAALIRQKKSDNLSPTGKIALVENKKKTILEIRADVEKQISKLKFKYEKDYSDEKKAIENAAPQKFELDENQKLTAEAKAYRQRRIEDAKKESDKKFEEDKKSLKESVKKQTDELELQIKTELTALKKVQTVSSVAKNMNITYGTYDGNKKGWVAYVQFTSDGVLLFQKNFVILYENLTGYKVPDLSTATPPKVKEYASNVDIYDSLFTRNVPILTYELDYTINGTDVNRPSEYDFNFPQLRITNISTGKVIQKVDFTDSVITRKMTPVYDLRTDEEKAAAENAKKAVAKPSAKPGSKAVAVPVAVAKPAKTSKPKKLTKEEKALEAKIKEFQDQMVYVAGGSFTMGSSSIYDYTGYWNDNKCTNPVKTVSVKPFYINKFVENRGYMGYTVLEAYRICNFRSKDLGYTPCYSYKGSTDPNDWEKYIVMSSIGGVYDKSVAQMEAIVSEFKCDFTANGYRLPTEAEWEYAAAGGNANLPYMYSGGDNLNSIRTGNLPNSLGIYGMSKGDTNNGELCYDTRVSSLKNYAGSSLLLISKNAKYKQGYYQNCPSTHDGRIAHKYEKPLVSHISSYEEKYKSLYTDKNDVVHKSYVSLENYNLRLVRTAE